MKKMDQFFTRERNFPLAEYESTGTVYRHIITGCEIVAIEAADEENLFAFVVPTPPENSSGLPHIIEHSVLSGSKKYPVKDPFAQLMQGSLQTFLNAMTYPDKTIYPASSLVEKDFFNLLKVYADAVFFPLLKKEIFLQEGHRLHMEEGDNILHSGVVYNEMKGNYSSMESIAGEWSSRSLFHESAYRFDSGGEPFEIAQLTYQDFVDFYKKYYHPSNVKVFFYGDIPAEPLLSFLQDEIFIHFEEGSRTPLISSEPKWDRPKHVTVDAPLQTSTKPGRDSKNTDTILINWLADEITDPLHALSMEILGEVLLGNQGAPLYKKIVDSRLGEDISPLSGTDPGQLQIIFSAGIRGADAEKAGQFESLIFGALEVLAKEGIPKDVLEGAVNRTEFRNREKRGGYPFGLRLLLKGLRGWLHGEPPEKTMEFSPWMEELRKQIDVSPRYFEDCISRYLLNNPHRTTVIVRGKQDYSVPELPIETDQKARAEEETALFNSFQMQEDRAEDLARIPVLHREDVPKSVEIIRTREADLHTGNRVFLHPLPTNGIVYLDIALPLDRLTREEQYFLPLLTSVIHRVGCADIPYDELSRRLFAETGGFTSFLEASSVPGGTKAFAFFRLKTLEAKLGEGLELTRKIFTSPDFGRIDKIKDNLMEMKNDLTAALIPRGNQYAMYAAAKNLRPALALEEIWKGIDQNFFLNHLAGMDPKDFDSIGVRLEELRHKICVPDSIIMQITADSAFMDQAVQQAGNFIETLDSGVSTAAGPAAAGSTLFTGFEELPFSGQGPLLLAVPSGVGFGAAVMRASWLGSTDNALEAVLGHALKTGYLWEEVRMKGGAYGVSSSANGTEGMYSFSTYRDPNSTNSLKVFQDSLEFAASGNIPDQVIEKAVIGTAGKELRPMQPGTEGFVGFRRKLYGITDESRQRKRNAMLETKTKQISDTAERLLQEFTFAESAVIADEKTLQALKNETGGRIIHLSS